jgi:hypothetical protein
MDVLYLPDFYLFSVCKECIICKIVPDQEALIEDVHCDLYHLSQMSENSLVRNKHGYQFCSLNYSDFWGTFKDDDTKFQSAIENRSVKFYAILQCFILLSLLFFSLLLRVG